jgi:hypothetical protein
LMVEDWSWSCRRMSGVCASRQIMQACPDQALCSQRLSCSHVHGARRRTEREGARERALTKLCRRFRSAERALHLRASIVGHAAWFCPRSTLPSCRSRPYCDGLENWCSHKKSVFFHVGTQKERFLKRLLAMAGVRRRAAASAAAVVAVAVAVAGLVALTASSPAALQQLMPALDLSGGCVCGCWGI